MEFTPVTLRVEAFSYDGTNGQDIVDQLNAYGDPLVPWSVVSEVSGSVVFERQGGFDQYTAIAGGYVVITGRADSLLEPITPTNFARRYGVLGDLVGEALPPAPPPTNALGVAAIPTLLGSQSATVQVTLRPEMPDTTYTAAATVIGGVSLLAGLSITATTKVSGSRVDITVQNTGLLSLSGASVLVAAVD